MKDVAHTTQGMSVPTQWALAVQHLLAVFSGTLIVPLVTGAPVSVTLLFAGISTLLFQFFTRWKIPFFYSCSFVFLGGVALIGKTCEEHGMTPAMGICYASFGIFVSALVFFILAQVVRFMSYERIMKWFPPELYGTYIMSLGIVLVGSSVEPIKTDWTIAAVAIAVTMVAQVFFRGIMKLIPFNIGLFVATAVSAIKGNIDLTAVEELPWIEMPFDRNYMAMTVFEDFDLDLLIFSILTILPLMIMAIVEHIADLLAISQTTKKDYIRTVGLPRTLSANGLSTMLSAMFGAPATTAFSQTTGLVALTQVFSTKVISFAAMIMIALAFSPKMMALVAAIPAAAIGGTTLLMYGMVIVVGLRAIVDKGVDLSNNRNMIIISVVLILAVGIRFTLDDSVTICGITLSGLTVAGLTGLVLNAVLPRTRPEGVSEE